MKLGNLFLTLALLALVSLAGYAKAVKKSNAARAEVLAEDFKQFVARMRLGQNLERFLDTCPFQVRLYSYEYDSITCKDFFTNHDDCTLAEYFSYKKTNNSFIGTIPLKNQMTIRWVRLESPHRELAPDVMFGYMNTGGGYRHELLVWKEFIE
jgi:hypothetical protein